MNGWMDGQLVVYLFQGTWNQFAERLHKYVTFACIEKEREKEKDIRPQINRLCPIFNLILYIIPCIYRAFENGYSISRDDILYLGHDFVFNSLKLQTIKVHLIMNKSQKVQLDLSAMGPLSDVSPPC